MANDARASRLAAKNKKTLYGVLGLALFMFAFAFMLVPLYSVVCKVTGLNGKFDLSASAQGAAAVDSDVDTARSIEVIFLATLNEQLPWDFKPKVTRVKVHPGEDVRLAYYAKNNSGRRMSVQAVPSVYPGTAADYIKKTECFCFTRQTFAADESHDMPLILRVDKTLPAEVKTLVLSYTLFGVDEQSSLPHVANTPGRID